VNEAGFLRVLVVDDEEPARIELSYLLGQDKRVGDVLVASDSTGALRILESETVDVVCLDIRMPGFDGWDLARVLRRFSSPPAVIFVTAYDEHAAEAFDLHAVDYLLKPVSPRRLADALERAIIAVATPKESPASEEAAAHPSAATSAAAVEVVDETIAVDIGGVTRFVKRSDVRYVEAHGDYARLVTDDGRHLVRIPLSVLEDRWATAGFVRIHRRWLVALDAIEEVRSDGGRVAVHVCGSTLEVSRRHARELRERLVHSVRLRRPAP